MKICFQKEMKKQHHIIPLLFDKVREGMASGKNPLSHPPIPAGLWAGSLQVCVLNLVVLRTADWKFRYTAFPLLQEEAFFAAGLRKGKLVWRKR